MNVTELNLLSFTELKLPAGLSGNTRVTSSGVQFVLLQKNQIRNTYLSELFILFVVVILDNFEIGINSLFIFFRFSSGLALVTGGFTGLTLLSCLIDLL